MKNYKLFCDGTQEALDRLQRYEQGDFRSLVQTGIKDLDEDLDGGLEPGTLTLIGAPTGGGKTTFLQQITFHAAEKGPVLFVTPEMTLAQLNMREIVRRSRKRKWDRNPWKSIPHARDEARYAHLCAANQIVEEALPVYVMEKPDATMLDVEEAAQELRPRLILLDYAQSLAGTETDNARYLVVGEVATRAVALALEMAVPVIVASQVNTIDEKGGGKGYRFRETAILEHIAATVMLFITEYENDSYGKRYVKKAEIICNKNRMGAMFRREVTFDPALFSVSSRETEVEVVEFKDWSK